MHLAPGAGTMLCGLSFTRQLWTTINSFQKNKNKKVHQRDQRKSTINVPLWGRWEEREEGEVTIGFHRILLGRCTDLHWSQCEYIHVYRPTVTLKAHTMFQGAGYLFSVWTSLYRAHSQTKLCVWIEQKCIRRLETYSLVPVLNLLLLDDAFTDSLGPGPRKRYTRTNR